MVRVKVIEEVRTADPVENGSWLSSGAGRRAKELTRQKRTTVAP